MRQGLVFGILSASKTVEVVAKPGSPWLALERQPYQNAGFLNRLCGKARSARRASGVRREERNKIVKKSVYAACAAALLFGVWLQAFNGTTVIIR